MENLGPWTITDILVCLVDRTHVSSRQVHICLLDRTHMSSRQDKNCESHFWPKVMTKNGVYHFYPSAKSRRELKIKTLGVIFRGASAYYVQKAIAPQKQAVCRFSDEFFFVDENFHWKILPKKKLASKNEMSRIIWNAFSQSLRLNRAILEG